MMRVIEGVETGSRDDICRDSDETVIAQNQFRPTSPELSVQYETSLRLLYRVLTIHNTTDSSSSELTSIFASYKFQLSFNIGFQQLIFSI
jgi:hypothetical protein